MSQNIFKNFENFWNKNDIKQKAEDYHNYFENTDKEGDFSWINKKDKSSLKENNITKSMKWGIPNHILGDIDKAKFIIGLLNPRTHMEREEYEDCDTVGEYIENEINIEKKENQSFSSKEVYEKNLNKELDMYDFYYRHILSKENVLSQELKKLYKIYINENSLPDNESLSQIAYYFSKYYKGGFNSTSTQIDSAKYHYERIFKKINESKRTVNNKKIDQKFEKALFDMPITNVELIPYRTKLRREITLKKTQLLESSKISANAIIEKIMKDKDTIVILRSYDNQGYNWKILFKEICEKRNIDFKKHIEPSIYIYKNDQGTSISGENIKPANPNNSIKPKEQVAKELNENINLSDFEKELDTIIESNNEG